MRKRFTASLAALAITGSALAAPQAFAQDELTGELTGGKFAWPVKQSLMEHLLSIAGGVMDTTEGAVFEGNQFVFNVNPEKTQLNDAGNGTIVLDGQANLRGYKGLGPNGGWGMDASYSDLRLVVDGTKVKLVGDYGVTGDQGGKGVEVNKKGDDVTIVTFELAAPIKPGADVFEIDRPSAAEEGLINSMGRYEVGQDLKTPVDLVLDYDDGNTPGEIKGTELEGSSKLSSELSTSSVKEGEDPVNLMGLIIGITATVGVLGIVAGIAGAVLNGVVPGVDAAKIRQTLRGLGIRI